MVKGVDLRYNRGGNFLILAGEEKGTSRERPLVSLNQRIRGSQLRGSNKVEGLKGNGVGHVVGEGEEVFSRAL